MKHHLTKHERIKGLEKALKSKRTPKQLKTSMRKTLKRLKH